MRKTIRSQMGNGFKQSRWGTHIVWTSSLIRMERRYRTRVTYQSTLSVIRSNENGWRFQMVLSDFILLNSMLPTIIKQLDILYSNVNHTITRKEQLIKYVYGTFDCYTPPQVLVKRKWFVISLLEKSVRLWYLCRIWRRCLKWLMTFIIFLESFQRKSQGK